MADDDDRSKEASAPASSAPNEPSGEGTEPEAQGESPPDQDKTQTEAAEPDITAESEPSESDPAESEPPESVVETAREAAEVFESAPAFEPAASAAANREPRRSFQTILLLYAGLIAFGALIALVLGLVMRLVMGPPPETTGHYDQIPALIQRADTLEQKHESSDAALKSALRALEARVAAVESAATAAHVSLEDIKKTVAESPLAGSIPEGAQAPASVDVTAILSRLDSVEQELKARPNSSGPGETDAAATAIHAEAIAIVATRLRQEIERGDPFVGEVVALERLGVAEAELVPLHPFAETGVASVRKLAEQFGQIAPSIIASEPAQSKASLLDRVTTYATTLVKIEKLEEPGHTDLRGIISRIKFALAHDNVADAYAVWSELPDAAKTVSEAFGTAAKARLDALNAARSIEAAAIASLGKPRS